MSEATSAHNVEDEFFARRELTAGEKKMVKSVFKAEKFDYDKIVILNRRHLRIVHLLGIKKQDDRAQHVNNKIFAPKKGGDYAEDYSLPSVSIEKKATFMHEMTHVWQNQAGKGRYREYESKYVKSDMAYSDPWVYEDNGEYTTLTSFYKKEKERLKIKAAGKIPLNPPRSYTSASAYLSERRRLQKRPMSEESFLKLWDDNSHYNYLKSIEVEGYDVELDFYKLNKEQQASIIEHYYYIKHCPAGQFDPYFADSVTWRKLPPIEFFKAIIPF